MKQILEEKLDRVIKEREFKWSFLIEENGIYGIEITASARSWWQNLLESRAFLKDDNLTLKIDNISFSKKSGKRGLFDSEVAWNGNNLKGLKKTNFFILKLNRGTHVLVFLANQTPKIEIIQIFKIEENELSYLPKDNYPTQEGNRRQWLTIVLYNFGLNSLKIKASAKQGKTFLFFKKDDSDLKLIINGQIQKNQEPKSHKNWFWCGNTLKGKSKLFEKELNLGSDIHYLEFWTDRNPEVEEITIGIEELKKIPTVDDPKWTGNFKDDPEEILLARTIYGEMGGESYEGKVAVGWAIRNRVEDPKQRWGKTYHDVVLHPFQFEPFNDPKKTVFKKITNPPTDDSIEGKAWQESFQAAMGVILGKVTDPTKGANHFLAKNAYPGPSWAKEDKFTVEIGNSKFYKL